VRITVVYDNTAAEPGLAAEWGFAAWIEYGDQVVLFDTGPDSTSLLSNLAQLDLDPIEIDAIVLSHAHGDHTGGLWSLLDTGIQPPVYAPASFEASMKRRVWADTELVEVLEPLEILPGLRSTGQMGTGIAEQGLVIETSEGIVVITGCAHPGIVRMVRQAATLVEGDLALVMGGFHLGQTGTYHVDGVIDSLRELGVRRVMPTHCTGAEAIANFAGKFGDDYVQGGAGQVAVVGSMPAPAAEPGSSPLPPAVDQVIASLDGLPIDQFFDASYKQLLLRNPEYLTSLRLSTEFGLRDDRLTDRSDASIRDTQRLETAILEQLRGYDRAALEPEQQLTYDVYHWYLDTQVRGHAFMYHNYPVHHFIGSYHFELDALFTEIQPLENREDVEDYIARLSQVRAQADQVLEGLKLRQELGIIPPAFIVDMAKSDITAYLALHSPDPASIDATELRVYARLDGALDELADLSVQEQASFRQQALIAIEESFIPALLALRDCLEQVRPLAGDHAGVWSLPDGDQYYTYLLRQQTSTELTPAEIHAIGLAEVQRIQQEIRDAFVQLGYSADAPFSQLMDSATTAGGLIDISTPSGKERYIRETEELIAEVDERVGEVFDLRPRGDVIVIGGPTGGYYMPGAPDGSRPGSYHVGTAGNWRTRYTMRTIAYHEAIPGHHFQIATAQELDLPLLRTDIGLNAFVEGWAVYGERLAWELNLYTDDPYGNIGRLQLELLRAVRLVTDTGIHAMQWTRQQAKDYLNEAMGAPAGNFSSEADRYVVLPAQATSYKIGMLKILELRQRAMDQLGDEFDIKIFHNLLLSNGSLPLDILDRVVQDHIDAQLAASQ
jgi:uncharacterized protein (DUF885 family)/metal-dependent hydrolase (beta-lactamase superfamily II)